MNRQEIFDKVYAHAMTMEKRSLIPGTEKCAYRGDGGAMCFVGCLIDDKHFDEAFECRTVADGLVLDALRSSGIVDDTRFLKDLQSIHDSNKLVGKDFKKQVKHDLLRFALAYNLETPE